MSGAQGGGPETTGMSDNGWHISPGDTEPKASREMERGRMLEGEGKRDDECMDKCMLVKFC